MSDPPADSSAPLAPLPNEASDTDSPQTHIPSTHPMLGSDAQAILAFARHREPPCPVCTYNLRGITQPKCPECGSELTIGIGVVHQPIAAWVTSLIALSVPCFFGVILWWSFFKFGAEIYDYTDGLIMCTFLYLKATVPAMAAVLIWRHRFWSLPPLIQSIIAFGICGIDALFILALIADWS